MVALDNHGDRIESYEVMQYVVETEVRTGSMLVGVYNSTEQKYMAYEREVLWPGSATEVPLDKVSGGVRCLFTALGAWSLRYVGAMWMITMCCCGRRAGHHLLPSPSADR